MSPDELKEPKKTKGGPTPAEIYEAEMAHILSAAANGQCIEINMVKPVGYPVGAEDTMK